MGGGRSNPGSTQVDLENGNVKKKQCGVLHPDQTLEYQTSGPEKLQVVEFKACTIKTDYCDTARSTWQTEILG